MSGWIANKDGCLKPDIVSMSEDGNYSEDVLLTIWFVHMVWDKMVVIGRYREDGRWFIGHGDGHGAPADVTDEVAAWMPKPLPYDGDGYEG